MTSRLITVLLTCACASVARADFNPVALTPGSYTYDVVVESNTPAALPYCINATSGSGTSEGDNTLFEQGYYARPGQVGGNYGVPPHNTVFTNINNSSVAFLMPPTYLTNNDLQLDSTTTTGGFTFNSPTTATNLAIMAGGSGTVTVSYVVTYSDSSTTTGTLNFSDWFSANGVQIAWGCNARVTAGGGFDVRSTSSANTTYPYMYSYYITVSGALPITGVTFTYVSGGHEANIYAISGKAPGSSTWVPIPLGGFNRMTTVPAAFPLTATMDQGTNTANNGNLATWFEAGYDAADPAVGLPPSGSTFTSLSQPTHHYQMGNYSANNSILVDANHLVVNITPASPAPFSSFAFLTAGGNVGGTSVMTNICILQHADGVQETNLFYGYDWFNGSVAPAFVANGRVNMYSRTLNNIGAGNPKLFESYFVLNDVGSPVTNIVVEYKTSPGANSTTFILAVSASAGGVAPVINAGALPATQTLFPTQSATFSVQESGTPPTTNFWEVESNGVYVPLPNGVDFNGSTVSGNGTATLTISDLSVNDGTNYIDVVANAFGSVTSAPAALVINTGTPVAPIIDSQIPASSIAILNGHVDTTTFSVTVDPSSTTPLFYQWYSGSTPIPGANNPTYRNIDTNAATFYCVVTNFGGSASSSPITISFIAKPTPTPYETAVLAYNPVAYWPLSETGGNIAFDYASTNDGTYQGTYSLGQPGLPDTAGIGANVSVGFDGATAYVDVPVGKLNITGPITLVQWIQTTSAAAYQTTLGHSDLSYRLDVFSTLPHFADQGPDVVGTAPINDGNWHMLVGVYDGSNQHLYVDGQPSGSPAPSSPGGSGGDVWIGGAPDYPGARNFSGNSAQVAIIPSALTAAQVAGLYSSIGVPPAVTITPASPTVYAGGSFTLTAQPTGSAPTHYQWYYIDNSNISNNIAGATNVSYTLAGTPLADNGYTFGVTVTNANGAATATVVLSVQNGPTYLAGDISPLAGEAYVGAPVTYTVVAAGSAPIYYQWMIDGTPVAGATNAVYTFPALCGVHTVQVAFTNSQSGGVPITSSQAQLQGDASPTNLTFNTDGTGWQLNNNGAGSVPYITGNVLELTDNGGNEASSAFYTLAQYVGNFTASFTYTPTGDADGACFVVQNSPAGDTALGGEGGGLGYFGITNSIAVEFNLYGIPGMAQGTNGSTYGNGGGQVYLSTPPVSVAYGDPINVQLNWAQGVLAVTLTDSVTLSTYSTNYVYGPLTPILAGSNLGYVGFTGGDGGLTSIQTISNFAFTSVIPTVSLTLSPVTTNSFVISWPAVDPSYQLQTTTSLTAPTWVAGPTPVAVNGVNKATVTVTGSAQQFYRLVRVVTCN